AALSEVLTERTAARDGLEWASSSAELGRVLYLIGTANDDTRSLVQSVGHYEGALRFFDVKGNRGSWLDIQIRLAHALSIIGHERQDAALLRKSADAFAAFAETATVEDSTYNWIVATNGRARGLIAACQIDGDGTRLPEAVESARRSVEAANKANDHES